MNTGELIDAIGMIRDETVLDAHDRYARPKKITGKTVLALVAAVVFSFALSVTALAAADVDAAYQLLYSFSPSVAQMVKPVHKSCVNNGIRMEVISAEVSGSDAYIYISMEDLEGDRIDGTVDLYDSYEINRSFDCVAHCELVNYDENTEKAMFLIHMQNMKKGGKIRGGKITFSVHTLLSGKDIIRGVLPVDLSCAADAAQTQLVSPDLIRGTGSNGQYPVSTRFLAPQEGGVYTPADGAQITAMGYIDGLLHIQIRYDRHRDGKWYYDNHGFLTLLDENGNEIFMDYFEFWGGDIVTRKTDWQVLRGYECFYQEYIVDIPPEELYNYSLNADLCLCDTALDGGWQVTFPLE